MNLSRADRLLVSLSVGMVLCASCRRREEPRPDAVMCEEDCEPRATFVRSFATPGEPAGAGGASASVEAVDIRGTIYPLNSGTLTADRRRAHFGGASVEMLLAETGGPVTTRASAGSFSLSGVISAPRAYAGVFPDAGTGALATIQSVDTAAGSDVELVVVDAATLDLAYAVVTAPQVRDENAAQVILRFADDFSGQALAGVKIEALDGERIEALNGVKVLYDDAGTWTDRAVGSGDRGLALIENVPAVGLSATPLTVALADDSTVGGSLTVLIGPGLVTYFEVQATD